MARAKKDDFVVGFKNQEIKTISKPLIKIIMTIQNEANEKNKNKKGRKASFVWASLELSRRIKE